MKKKKISLNDIGAFFLQLIPETGWVTMDIEGIKVFDNLSPLPPMFNRQHERWEYAGVMIAKLIIPLNYIISRPYTVRNDIIFEKCIECVSPSIVATLEEKKRKYTKHHHGVLAYFADGSTLLFDSKAEARDFFGFRRIDQVTQYIKTGNPLPDGTTTLDEALDETPPKPKGRPPKKKKANLMSK